MTKSRGSLLNVLKHGVELANYKLNLMYIKPATTFNKELLENYNKNIFSVMEEVWASDREGVVKLVDEIHLTTKLDGQATFFLPFNMGNGEGVNAGKGNPVYEDKYSVSYMWEDILTKETVLDLINKFIFIETKESTDELTGKNYLIQHSAGSGKTNSIAWLAHRLSSLHDAYNKIIYDNIIVVTDRIVVDRQLQSAILG